jgi:AGZA family xanthine/uracil permease-like MFS transporter
MFQLAQHGTTVRTELVAGVTTFLTMAYIIFVNPEILSAAGMDRDAVFVATCIAAIIGTLIMGLVANYPIALAPGMGLNAFFAFTVVLTYGFTWQEALGAVFCSGVLFVLLSIFKVREAIINAFPRVLKMATSAGIGLFLGIIALKNAGIVVAHPATYITLGNLVQWPIILMILGFVLIAVLNHHQVIGGTVIGILAVALLGLPLGLTEYTGLVSMPPDVTPTLLALDLSRVFDLTFLVVVFTLLFVDVFDTAGTLIGVSHRAQLLDEQDRLPRMKQALLADSSATVAGALVGTSNTTSYIESAAGVSVGGRTGLTAVVTAGCFALALFMAPLAGMIPAYATAAALLYVACVMAQGLTEIDWNDTTEYVPGVVTAIAMPLTFSIAAGIGLGMITYVLIKLFSGKFRQVSWPVIGLAVAFCVFFAVEGL